MAKQVQNIDREIETAQNERRKSPSAATDTGKKLVNNKNEINNDKNNFLFIIHLVVSFHLLLKKHLYYCNTKTLFNQVLSIESTIIFLT